MFFFEFGALGVVVKLDGLQRFNEMQCRRYLIGSPAIQIVPGLRSRNISVYCAMNKDGIVRFRSQTTAFRTITFVDFIDDLLNHITSIKAIVVLDNVPFYKHHTIKEKF